MKTRFALSDPLLYADMREALRLGAELLYDHEDGLLLRRKGKLFEAGDTPAGLPVFLESGMALVRSGELAESLMREGRFTECMEVLQLVYTGDSIKTPECKARIRCLEMGDMDFVLKNYHHPNSRPEYIGERIKELMLGAFINGALVGCAGVHAEGAMGMLEIIPECRRMGIGRALQAELIKTILKEGGTPYCHVEPGNEISLSLQRSLGLKECKERLYWLYKLV